MKNSTQTVAVIGTGTIGASWAALFAARGLKVQMFDARPDALTQGKQNAAQWALQLTADAAGVQDRLRASPTLDDALSGADFIQESVLERYPEKRAAHEAIERHARPDAILATSSSGLLASQMQAGLTSPARFLVAHPFNPPHLIPLVELVPGPATSEDVLRASHDFYTALGKIPIVLRKEVPGHIANRLVMGLWREAIDLVANGVATLEDVDKALYAGPGVRWACLGQHLIYHLNGGPGGYQGFFDHFASQNEAWLADMARWTEIPPAARAEVVRQMSESIRHTSREELVQERDKKVLRVLHALYPQKVSG